MLLIWVRFRWSQLSGHIHSGDVQEFTSFFIVNFLSNNRTECANTCGKAPLPLEEEDKEEDARRIASSYLPSVFSFKIYSAISRSCSLMKYSFSRARFITFNASDIIEDTVGCWEKEFPLADVESLFTTTLDGKKKTKTIKEE